MQEPKWLARLFTMTVLVVSGVVALSGCAPKEHAPTTKKGLYGTVAEVSNCRVGKYSYTCTVKTNLKVFAGFSVNSFPGNMVNPGDVLYYTELNYGDRVEEFMCRNSQCKPTGTCYWFMACFAEYSESNGNRERN